MVRVKFLVFALLALGLGVIHLRVLSQPLGAQALEEAQAQAQAGTAEVVRTLEARREVAGALALKLAARPELVAAVRELTGPAAPTEERYVAVSAAAQAALPQEMEGAVIAVVTQAGAWHARLGAEPAQEAALDVKALIQPEAPMVVEAFGAPHAFAAVPVVWKFARIPGAVLLETELQATLVVGVPLLPEGALESAATASGAVALGVVKEEAVVASGGARKQLVDTARGTLKAGQPGTVVERGQVQSLGPVKLPMFTAGDFLGGQAPLVVGSRLALEGMPYEVIALASPKLLGPLADYQRTALFGLAGLLGASLVWTLLMGSGSRRAEAVQETSGDMPSLGSAMESVAPPPAPEPVPEPEPAPEPLLAAPVEPQPAEVPAEAAEPLPAASDDFGFGPPLSEPQDPFAAAPEMPAAEPFGFPPPPEAMEPQPEPQYETPAEWGAEPQQEFEPQPFGPAPTPFDAEPLAPLPQDEAGVATATPRAGHFSFEELPTAAYSLQQAADPYAAAAAMDSPETTRVAAIPRELLQASARPPTQENIPVPPPRMEAPPTPAVAPVPWNEPAPQSLPGSAYAAFLGNVSDGFSEEEYHFQEVFREFVLTRERCFEPADGLTYDKFVQKLRKNKEQLMQKYACRTVRFQVYVKEGKAALKATPVKD